VEERQPRQLPDPTFLRSGRVPVHIPASNHDCTTTLQVEGYGSVPELALDKSSLVSRLAVLPIVWPNDPPPLQGSKGTPGLARRLEGGDTEPEVEGEGERWEPNGRLGQHWRLEGQIGRGSFGEVWHASRFGPPARGVPFAKYGMTKALLSALSQYGSDKKGGTLPSLEHQSMKHLLKSVRLWQTRSLNL